MGHCVQFHADVLSSEIRLQPFMEILRSHRAEDRPVYSRVDYYSHHLYICVVRHKLDDSYHQSISNIIVENMKTTQTRSLASDVMVLATTQETTNY